MSKGKVSFKIHLNEALNNLNKFYIGISDYNKLNINENSWKNNGMYLNMNGYNITINTIHIHNFSAFSNNDILTITWNINKDLIEFYKNKTLISKSKFTLKSIKMFRFCVYLYNVGDGIEILEDD